MRIKLTLRYLVMVLISTVLLIVSAFFVLTYLEDTPTETPRGFTYSLSEEIYLDENENVILSEKGMERLVAEDAWLQILNREGYVVESFNAISNLADHYSPFEIDLIGASDSFRSNYIYNLGVTNEDTIFIVGLQTEEWFSLDNFEMGKEMVQQFGKYMVAFTFIILLIMGFIFSQRIAKPVTKIIRGVEELSDGDYESKYTEKGLYKPVFSQLNRLANRLQSSEIEREKTKQQREKWISNISHDLKTPLSTIKGYSEILADANYVVSPAESQQYSSSIYEKSLYMEDMIEELRLNEQLMQEEIELEKETVNLVAFVREIIVDILNHPEYTERTIEFNADEEELNILINRDLMRRAIENLIYNALVHNDSATVVTVNMRTSSGKVLLEIIDNGRGMDEDEKEQLFNRYYRGSNTTNYKGTGLGMSIAKEVIEAHDGVLQVESELNQGTEITILFR